MLIRSDIDILKGESADKLNAYGRRASSFWAYFTFPTRTNNDKVNIANNLVNGVPAWKVATRLYNYDRRFFLFRWLLWLFSYEKQRSLLCYVAAQRLLQLPLSLKEYMDALDILNTHAPRLTSSYLKPQLLNLLGRINQIVGELPLLERAKRICSFGTDSLLPNHIAYQLPAEQALQLSSISKVAPVNPSKRVKRARHKAMVEYADYFFNAIYNEFTFTETADPIISQHQLHLDQLQQLSNRLSELSSYLQIAGKDEAYNRHQAQECIDHYLYPLIRSYMAYYIAHPEERENVSRMMETLAAAAASITRGATLIFSFCQRSDEDPPSQRHTVAAAAQPPYVDGNASSRSDSGYTPPLHGTIEAAASASPAAPAASASLQPAAADANDSDYTRQINQTLDETLLELTTNSTYALIVSARPRPVITHASVRDYERQINDMPIEPNASSTSAEINAFKQQFIDAINEHATRWQKVEQELKAKKAKGDTLTEIERYHHQEQLTSRKEYMRLWLFHPNRAELKYGDKLTNAMFVIIEKFYETTRKSWLEAIHGDKVKLDEFLAEMQAFRKALARARELLQEIKASAKVTEARLTRVEADAEITNAKLAAQDAVLAAQRAVLAAQRAATEALKAQMLVLLAAQAIPPDLASAAAASPAESAPINAPTTGVSPEQRELLGAHARFPFDAEPSISSAAAAASQPNPESPRTSPQPNGAL